MDNTFMNSFSHLDKPEKRNPGNVVVDKNVLQGFNKKKQSSLEYDRFRFLKKSVFVLCIVMSLSCISFLFYLGFSILLG